MASFNLDGLGSGRSGGSVLSGLTDKLNFNSLFEKAKGVGLETWLIIGALIIGTIKFILT